MGVKRAPQVTGEEIIAELERHLEQSLEPLRYTVLAPSVFDVHLHPDDFARLASISAQVISEARQALDERLEKLRQEAKRGGILTRLGSKAPRVREFKSVAGGWFISFYENTDPDAAPGDILIDSQLTLPASPELSSGSQTRRITTLRHQGTSRRLEADEVLPVSPPVAPVSGLATSGPGARSPAAPGSSPPPAPQNENPRMQSERSAGSPVHLSSSAPESAGIQRPVRPDVTTDKMPGSLMSEGPSPTGTPSAPPNMPVAVLRYSDNAGDHERILDLAEFAIGRGGPGHWVDVQLDTLPDVSRTHLKIRRDEHGRYFARDVSAYGCTVNGEQMPSSLERQGDRKLDRGREVELPSRARIGLADVILLEFEVRRA